MAKKKLVDYLFQAVKDNDFRKVNYIISLGADVDARDVFNNTPIFEAQSKEMIELLIDNCASIDVQNFKGETPIMAMIARKNVEGMECLIKQGADLTIRNNDDLMCPLCLAVKNDFREGVEILLKNGVEVDTDNKYKRTELMYAKSVEVQNMLIENGADVNAKDDLYQTVLANVINWEGKIELVDNLLKHGANPNQHNYLNEISLEIAMFKKYCSNWHLNDKEWDDGDLVIESLIRAGCDVNHCSIWGTKIIDEVNDEGKKVVFKIINKIKKEKMEKKIKGFCGKFLGGR
jgi:ankyrin repeat protein